MLQPNGPHDAERRSKLSRTILIWQDWQAEKRQVEQAYQDISHSASRTSAMISFTSFSSSHATSPDTILRVRCAVDTRKVYTICRTPICDEAKQTLSQHGAVSVYQHCGSRLAELPSGETVAHALLASKCN